MNGNNGIPDFIPHETDKGCYWTHDGYLADLGWNPHEQLKIKPKRIVSTAKRHRRKDYERTMELLFEERPKEERQSYQMFLTCEWCKEVQNSQSDLHAGICTDCLYKPCASCGKIFRAHNPKKATCSQNCSEILHSKRGRWLILERDNFTCIYCGLSAPNDAALLHVDHILPVAEGGRSFAGNLITSCKGCNMEKGKRRMQDKTITEIMGIAYKRNKERNIENTRVMRLRDNDVV